MLDITKLFTNLLRIGIVTLILSLLMWNFNYGGTDSNPFITFPECLLNNDGWFCEFESIPVLFWIGITLTGISGVCKLSIKEPESEQQ
ncbi:hypothetical protein VIRA109638_04865 [Vibrio rarus]